MPLKGALRVIFTIYKEKANEFAAQDSKADIKKKLSTSGQDKQETTQVEQENFVTGSIGDKKSSISPSLPQGKSKPLEEDNEEEKGQALAVNMNLTEWAYESF